MARYEKKNMKLLQEYGLYFFLLIGFLLIRLIPVSVGAFLDDVINDFAIGGFASVFVALCIQIKDSRNLKRRNRVIADRVYYDVIENVFGYLKLYPIYIGNSDPSKKNEKKNFYDWNEYYCEMAKNNKLSDVIPVKVINGGIDRISNSVYDLVVKQDWYLSEGIFAEPEIEFFKNLYQNCIQIKLSIEQETINYDFLQLANEELMNELERRPELADIMSQAHGGYDYQFFNNLKKKP